MGMKIKSFFTFKDWVGDYVEDLHKLNLIGFVENTVCNSLKEEWDKFLFVKYVEGTELWKQVRELKAVRVVPGIDEFHEIQQEIEELNAEIDSFEVDEESWKQSIKSSNNCLREKKAHLNILEKEHPKSAQSIDKKMQDCLKILNSHPEVYHGGEFNGVCSHQLMLCAKDLFEALHENDIHSNW